MALREFTRLTSRVLARLGEDARLRGSLIGKANVEHGVQMQGTEGELVGHRIIATMLKAWAPLQGNTLETGSLVDGVFTPDTNYIVDSPVFADNGYSVRVIVRKV